MKRFATLFARLDETTKTNRKVDALAAYFSEAPPEDAAWALYFLSGRKLRQIVPTRKLAGWAAEEAGLSEWLFEESYHAVGDLAETIALVLPEAGDGTHEPLHRWVEDRLLPLRGLPEEEQRPRLIAAWRELTSGQRFVWNKLITGSFRVGVSQGLVLRGLSRASGIEPPVLEHRMMGHWEPTAAWFTSLLAEDTEDVDTSRPYPFFLAHPLEAEPDSLGDPAAWQAEWKWDGIRAQLVRRSGETFLWSRGEELVTDRYPELHAAAERLPDGTVLDGELLGWKDGRVLPFAELQRRIGRKTVGKAILNQVPVRLVAYDILERLGEDIRPEPLQQRRIWLEEIVSAVALPDRLGLSPLVLSADWSGLAAERETSREQNVEGLMLKRLDSPYRVGRVRGDWWKWKITPLSVDAVLIYAQAGSGRRASLYTDYTFALWNEQGELVPFAKAYSGLSDEEIRKVDAFIRRNTIEQFGPVRSVKPELVFELAFENISRSKRHKSGVAVRFPRILRWRTDKPIEEADRLETLWAQLTDEPA